MGNRNRLEWGWGQMGGKNLRALRCTRHSNEPLKRKSCQQWLPRFLSLISMVQKSFAQILSSHLTTPPKAVFTLFDALFTADSCTLDTAFLLQSF